MSKKIFSPGETVEDSGLYPVVGPDGEKKGYEVTVVEGEPFPPTPEKGWGFGSPRLAKSKSSDDPTSSVTVYSPPPLPNGRPVFKTGLNLVPSNTLPERRPVLKGTKDVSSFDHLPLHRPIFHSDLNVVAMHGNRPVVALETDLVPSSSLPENRPISSQSPSMNLGLMGYLD